MKNQYNNNRAIVIYSLMIVSVWMQSSVLFRFKTDILKFFPVCDWSLPSGRTLAVLLNGDIDSDDEFAKSGVEPEPFLLSLLPMPLMWLLVLDRVRFRDVFMPEDRDNLLSSKKNYKQKFKYNRFWRWVW